MLVCVRIVAGLAVGPKCCGRRGGSAAAVCAGGQSGPAAAAPWPCCGNTGDGWAADAPWSQGACAARSGPGAVCKAGCAAEPGCARMVPLLPDLATSSAANFAGRGFRVASTAAGWSLHSSSASQNVARSRHKTWSGDCCCRADTVKGGHLSLQCRLRVLSGATLPPPPGCPSVADCLVCMRSGSALWGYELPVALCASCWGCGWCAGCGGLVLKC